MLFWTCQTFFCKAQKEILGRILGTDSLNHHWFLLHVFSIQMWRLTEAVFLLMTFCISQKVTGFDNMLKKLLDDDDNELSELSL